MLYCTQMERRIAFRICYFNIDETFNGKTYWIISSPFNAKPTTAEIFMKSVYVSSSGILKPGGFASSDN